MPRPRLVAACLDDTDSRVSITIRASSHSMNRFRSIIRSALQDAAQRWLPSGAAAARARRAGAFITLGLLLLAAHPLLNGDPAKYVHVRWSPEITPAERRQLERRFDLREEQGEGQSFGYDLLDDSPGNIRALLEHPAVDDTHDLDRARFAVSESAENADSRTGIAWRWGLEAGLPYMRPVGLALIFLQGSILLHCLLSGSFFLPARLVAPGRTAAPARFLELDALRGFATIAVALFHFTTRFGNEYGHSTPPLFLVPLGSYGVHLFFIISGMVIFLTIERSRSAAEFVVARVGRLYPAYWVAVTLTFVAMAVVGLPPFEVSTPQYAWNLTMAHRFVNVADMDGAYWSLQVELVFYLLMLGLLALRAIPIIEPILLGWLLVLSLDASTGVVAQASMNSRTFHDFVTLYGYAEFFIIGIVLHLRRAWGSSPALTVALAWALIYHATQATWESTAIAFGLTILTQAAIRGDLRWLAARPLLFLGAISYPLYLLHQHIGYLLLLAFRERGLPTNVAIPLALVVVIAIAAALHYAVERPGQTFAGRLRRRLSRASGPRRAAAAAV